jgi:hypothetical protein
MRTDKSSQPIDPLEILPRLNWAESDEGLVERIGADKGGHWALRGEVTVHGSGRRGSATCRVSPPPTPPHNVADSGESVMAASVAATLRGGGHAPTCERLRGEA